MNLNNTIYIILFFFFSNCTKENLTPLYNEECINCVEYQYEQAYNNESILLVLESKTYCIGDSAWLMPDNNYWAEINDNLITIMVESGYCTFLELDTIQ